MATGTAPGHLCSNQTDDNTKHIDDTGQLAFALHSSRRLIAELPHSSSKHERRINKDEGSTKDGTTHRGHKGQVRQLPSHCGQNAQKADGDLVLQSIRSLLIRNLEQIKVSIPSSDKEQRISVGI